jgi:hypothetical protein
VFGSGMLEGFDGGGAAATRLRLALPVLIGQAMALFITLISQNDLVCGLTLLFQGYDDTTAKGIGKSFPQATKVKWGITATSLVLGGLLSLLVNFFCHCLPTVSSTSCLTSQLSSLSPPSWMKQHSSFQTRVCGNKEQDVCEEH